MRHRDDRLVYWIPFFGGYDAKLRPDGRSFARAKLLENTCYEYELVWFCGPRHWQPTRYQNINRLQRQVDRWLKAHRTSLEHKLPPDPMQAPAIEREQRMAEERARRRPRDMDAARALMKKIEDDFELYGGRPWDLRDMKPIEISGR